MDSDICFSSNMYLVMDEILQIVNISSEQTSFFKPGVRLVS